MAAGRHLQILFSPLSFRSKQTWGEWGRSLRAIPSRADRARERPKRFLRTLATKKVMKLGF